MRPASREPEPAAIEQAEGKLIVGWDDQVRTEVPYRALRLACPCAGCVEEWSGKRTVDPASIPEGVHPVALEPVGNYAVSITWSDGHSTGIYSWATLRSLGRPIT